MRQLALVALCALSMLLAACGGGGGSDGPGIPPVEILSSTLDDAQVGAPFSYALSAGGGEGNYIWSLAADSPSQLPNSISLNPSTGILSGMPSDADAGLRTLRFMATDGVREAEATFSLRVRERLSIALNSLPDAMEGSIFNLNLASNGGSASVRWTLAANSDPLPPGLTLDSDAGRIIGSPANGAAGTHMVTLVADDGRANDTRVLPLTIHAPGLAITTHDMPTGVPGVSYGHVLRAIGNTGAMTWSVAAGSAAQLPNGIALAGATGFLTGNPAAGSTGSYNITFRVDAGGQSDEETLSLVIGTTTLAITTPALPTAREGGAYSTKIRGVGGNATRSYSVATLPGNALPTGLVMESSGVIHGRAAPGTQGDHNVTLRVSSGSEHIDRAYVLRITGSQALDAKLALTEAERLHFLTRTEFGVTKANLARLNALGFADYVEEMINLKASTAVENDAKTEINDWQFPSSTHISRWMIRLMQHTNAPFQETMTHFWTDHFAMDVSAFGSQNRYYFRDKHQHIRTNFAGNFREMLIDISVQPAMLMWLDGITSLKGKINENYAREFWELFTLGVDNGYTQADIEESARVFTGFKQTFDGTLNHMEFFPARHDDENKSVFGHTIVGRSGDEAWREIEDLVDLTLAEKPVAEFICKKIFEHLVYIDPDQEIIDDLATTLRQSNWEFKPVLRKILMSNAMFSDKAKAGLVKSPVEYAIGLSRSSGVEPTAAWIDGLTRDAGQRLSSPPDVAGWTRGTRWLSSDALVHRTNLANRLITNRNVQEENSQSIELAMPPLGQRSDAQVVDHLLKMFNVKASVADRQTYIDYLNNDADSEGVLTPNAFDSTSATTLDRKIRGLIYMLSQHPSYHLR